MNQVDAVFAYVAMKGCPDLDPRQVFGGYVESLADAAGGGGGVEEETSAVTAVVPYSRRAFQVVCWEDSSCLGRWNYTQLHHQTEGVHEDACLSDFAVLKPVDDHTPNFHGPSRCRHAKKLPSVRTSPLEAAQHLLALGNLLLDGEVQVGKPSLHAAQDIFQSV
jgi:hypothetical protein